MSDDQLFPGYDNPEPAPAVSAGRRRTARQAAAVTAGRHPLTGQQLHPLASPNRDAQAPKDDPYTCGSCYFRGTVAMTRHSTFPKCLLPDPTAGADAPQDRIYTRVSGSETSDVRAWWPACPDYSPGDSLSPDAARSIPQ